MVRKLMWFIAIWAVSVVGVGTFAEALHWLLMRQ
jgi:hypothetical protein